MTGQGRYGVVGGKVYLSYQNGAVLVTFLGELATDCPKNSFDFSSLQLTLTATPEEKFSWLLLMQDFKLVKWRVIHTGETSMKKLVI